MIFGDLVRLSTAGPKIVISCAFRSWAKACEAVEKLVVANVGYLIWRSFGVIMANDRDQPK